LFSATSVTGYAPLLGKNHIFRRTHAEDHLHIGLRAIFCQPAAHRHNRRHATAGGQQQEFIFRFIVTGEITLASDSQI
jgi:hypothetical protein